MFWSLYIGLPSAILPSSSSTVVVNCIPQRQHNISVVSHSNNCIDTGSDSHTTISSNPVTILSAVECLTMSSSVTTTISGQDISITMTTAGV